MILTMSEAKDTLRIAQDSDYLDTEIQTAIQAIPRYLKVTTGKTWDSEPINPIAKECAKVLLKRFVDYEVIELKDSDKILQNLLFVLSFDDE